MKTEGLTNQLIEAIKILKHVKAQNIEQNKMIDAFLDKVLKELGAKDDQKKDDKKKTPEEKKEEEEAIKRGQEMLREIVEKEEKRKEMELLKKRDALSKMGLGDSTATTPYVPLGSTIVSRSGGTGRMVGGPGPKPALPFSDSGIGSIDTTRDHKGGGGGSPADRVVPPGKVWCTTCEEYHDAGVSSEANSF